MSNTIQFRRTTAILALVAASIGGGLVAAFAVASRSHDPMYVVAHADSRPANQLSDSFADIIEKASPSVVNIQSTRVIKASEQQGNGENPFFADPFFRQFFGGRGNQQPRDQRESGLGSGVIIDPSGYIVTNNHVVEKATTVKVTLLDKREFTAKVVGADPQTDVAVVKIDASNLHAMPLGNSDAARVGDLCFAIGNPFGQDHTVTMGIVSAKGRSLPDGVSTRIQNFLQTDAAINPGNSGGALINARGELIGINTAILTGGGGFGGEGGNIGIGFAVPVNLARNVMDQIIKSGKVSRGYMGVTLGQLTPDVASQLGLKNNAGALVNDVTPGSPGAKGGLKQWDVITAIDGHPVADYNELTLAVTEHRPGSTVALDIIRDGKPMQVKVTLGERPSGLDWAKNGGPSNGNAPEGGGDQAQGSSARGIKVQALTPDLAQQLQVPSTVKGVVVDDVDPDSPAADQIGQGDIITSVDRKPVHNVQEFVAAMNQAQGKSVLVAVNRGGRDALLVLAPGK
jgi:Do/DeqQ family serine protease